jgi:simple sugar transport system permease protein
MRMAEQRGAWGRVLAGSYLYLGLALLLVVGTLVSDKFLSQTNLRNVLNRASIVGVLSVGMTLVILTAGIDLSVGSLLSFGSVLCALLVMGRAWNAASYVVVPSSAAAVFIGAAVLANRLLKRVIAGRSLRIVVSLVCGALVGGLAVWLLAVLVTRGFSVLAVLICVPLTIGLLGALSGTLVAKFRLQPFIVTLAMMIAAVGLAKVISGKGGEVVSLYYADPDASPAVSASIEKMLAGQGRGFGSESFNRIGKQSVLGKTVPVPALFFLGAVVVAHFLLTRTPFGRYTYAVGGNEEAARLSGVNVGRVKIAVYAMSGALAGLAGALFCAQYDQGTSTAGDKMELDAIAAVVIGGTSLMGGRGKVLGTLVGVLFFAYLTNILNLAGYQSQHQQVVTGLTIVIAVILQEGWLARGFRMLRVRFRGRKEEET